MIQLPTKKVKPVHTNPRKLMIFSAPKVGKTSAVAALDNCLIIGLEKGTSFLESLSVEVDTLDGLLEVAKAIKEENNRVKGFAYDYIAIDTVTKLEDIAKVLALELYKQTPMGKSFQGDVAKFMALPNGAAYGYLRDAFEKIYNTFDGLSKCLILLGHLKKASITKAAGGGEIAARDLDLTGKLKSITAADMDAISYMYRKGNQCILSFKTSEDDCISGARPDHLRNKEIILTEMVDNKLVSHWDKIFLNNQA